MGCLDDIQTALKPFLKNGKISNKAKSFKTMNCPVPTVMLFDGLFLGKYKR